MISRKIVLLDLGGVVFQTTGFSNKEIDWSIISKLNHKYGHQLNLGLPIFPTFLRDYNALTRQHLTGPDFLREVFNTLEFNRSLIDMVLEHRDIVIVSDNYPENIEYIAQRYQFKDWAIKQFYSFDYKLEKADPAFFSRLLADLQGQNLDDLLYIDDSPAKIRRAQTHGISGILFESNQQISALLSSSSSA